ncbi:MAG: PilZ domain-containing protein [Proteobacteria bacterium]|nr:PilZ domain-containing protein [Pseudomonadota bacterium]MBU1387697.1 PilZ domain-containing protein [Pseudomonadota bacterium]MBU1543729.1 PilZ domain-containing protein [Pseudomonadota bacterium]MBU2429399.1 PilZ domain-containing protein [Pseudomonadota bacterium]MBU2480429.1 PilZ domain-containing protein [Pseudomonadota bacterium]
MVGRKRTVERRKNKRYKAVEGAYAAVSPNSHRLGQIIDISMGGLAFKYIDTSNEEVNNDASAQDESIFLSSMGYYVGDLPFTTVSDYEVTNAPSFSSMKVRKRHVQFKDLSFKQLFDLDYYLRNNVSEQLEKLPQQYKS